MSAVLEQSAEDLAFLVDAKVTGVAMVFSDPMWGGAALQMTFDLAKPVDVEGTVCKTVVMEILQDIEGNGPGYLALVDGS